MFYNPIVLFGSFHVFNYEHTVQHHNPKEGEDNPKRDKKIINDCHHG
jgi:hypothetical protein